MDGSHKPHIFVLEDSMDHWHLVDRALNDGYKLTHAKSVAEAHAALENGKFDLLVIDVVLPDGTGFDVCSWAQTRPFLKEVPVVFLTSKSELDNRLLGFELGADDYISKPCTMKELRARIDAKIRRRRQSVGLKFEGLQINFLEQEVFAKFQSGITKLDLTPREYKLLCFLARNSGVILSRDQILKEVWSNSLTDGTSQVHVSSRSIDTHIAALRKKMGPFSRYIKSVHGTGYRFQAPPAPTSLQSA